MHPFLTDQVAKTRLAEIHAEAMRRRTIRDANPGRGWRFWRRPPPGPPPRVVVAIPRPVEPLGVSDSTLRPVA
jgi:hypothetical protein